MKVKELIEKLQEQDQELEVCVATTQTISELKIEKIGNTIFILNWSDNEYEYD